MPSSNTLPVEHRSAWQDTTNVFYQLALRDFISPSFLSSLMMHIVLPGKCAIHKKYPVETHDGKITDETLTNWIKRNYDSEFVKTHAREKYSLKGEPIPSNYFDEYIKRVNERNQPWYDHVYKTHSLDITSVNGIETFSIMPKSNHYDKVEIFFCGNAQDALSLYGLNQAVSEEYKDKRCIYWNYPGVGRSHGSAASEDALFESGLNLVLHFMKEMPDKKFILHGFSLGGSVAIDVALKLHQQNRPVDLVVKQSFSDIARVIPTVIKNGLNPHPAYLPLVSAVVSNILIGLSFGTTTAGFISTIGLAVSGASITVSYVIASMIQTLGFLLSAAISSLGQVIAFSFPKEIQGKISAFFNQCAYHTQDVFNWSAHEIANMVTVLGNIAHLGIDLMGSMLGGSIAISGILVGLFSGLAIGALLSIQNLWTKEPLSLPMIPVFNLALASICCNIHSAEKIKQLIEHPGQNDPTITISHSLEDLVIPKEASLLYGLGISPGEINPHSATIKSSWYREGGHGADLTGLIPEKIMKRENDVSSTTDSEHRQKQHNLKQAFSDLQAEGQKEKTPTPSAKKPGSS